ncbi:cyclic pyranopterin monophosphate synthase MoaC [Mucilaginibacter daejeonensis]|uniref:cyclic pyranopterin monophosphate synthase MoaC n=1 Tax=Mucilaginibacter daejeonensis TaxID=398049 RepID=UPI001D173929|nr:cyclic pyranopterin monophosphate synthase MoaC [Mucilaginibacter daejeonensis]UEG53581.1 cyclic pyranopterin monophosphate synthase MoaC [Mucilaginibacter daejeonensis]
MASPESTFTHIDPTNNFPSMVDVGDKQINKRMAKAQSVVVLPSEVIALLSNNDIGTKKGPVFQTAIIAGTMAVKRTAELIPLCHPLPIDNCKIKINLNEKNEVVIECIVSMTGKTGVEMEALTGASIAALTIYDMCKSFSHNIVIKETKLLEKTGGKSDHNIASPQTP